MVPRMYWGTLRIRLAAPLLFVAPLAAQSGPPAYVPPIPPVLNVRVSEVPELIAAWPKMRIYGLLEEYGLTEGIARGARSMVPDAERLRAVREAAQKAGFDLGAYEVANLMRVNGPQLPPGARPEDIRQFALLTHQWRGENGSPRTAQLAVTSCVPRALGRWARIYADEIRWWRECGWFQPVEGVKIDGLPVAAFALSEAQQEEVRESWFAASNRWFAQAPGSFVIASGPLDQIGRFEMAPPADAPGMHFEANVDAVRESEAGRMAPGEELLLGAASPVAEAFCRSRLAGDHGLAFGTLAADVDFGAAIARALPG